jgi:carbamoyltransferase
MNILGISCLYHDSAAALLRDGDLVAAAHEERFTRKRHDSAIPRQAVSYCLREAGLAIGDVDYLVFYDKPLIKFERILMTYLATFPRSLPSFSKAIPLWLKEKLFVPKSIERELGYTGQLLFAEHHQSHAASAFLPSPFEEAAILTIDGVGEWATATQGVGRGNQLELQHEIRFPHSLGLLYSAFTYYLGFKVNSAEYKVMGAAPYGVPKYVDQIFEHLIHVREDGSFKMNMKYFAYDYGLTMTNKRFDALFGHPRREPESKMEQFHWDMAASIQRVTEEIVLAMARDLHRRTGMKNLVMAGGVALNCVANGRLAREGPFEQIWVQPAAGDAGGALGAAMFAEHCVLGRPRKFQMRHAFWGPSFSDAEIRSYLDIRKAPSHGYSREQMIRETARLLDEKQAVVGWFQGRMEWGPRALGNRSILGDPRRADMKDILNLKIKRRESFRPFAPSVLREHVKDWFEQDDDVPFMMKVFQIREERRAQIPAVTHVDGSGRLQTVYQDTNERYHALISAFHARTGVPLVLNTSFNENEPVVCLPDEALACFLRTKMDVLVLGDFFIERTA